MAFLWVVFWSAVIAAVVGSVGYGVDYLWAYRKEVRLADLCRTPQGRHRKNR